MLGAHRVYLGHGHIPLLLRSVATDEVLTLRGQIPHAKSDEFRVCAAFPYDRGASKAEHVAK
jgi:hypothetical protein